MDRPPPRKHQGFTLIELSIVLVIIGLIIGGILVGQDLISAAATRAQIAQIEKYNSAANTFYGKFGYLPGDITPQYATQFGFVTRAGTTGRGNGNGILEGWRYDVSQVAYGGEGGEPLLFWADLSQAGLMEGLYNTATDSVPAMIYGLCTGPTCITSFTPPAKVGSGNFIYVYGTQAGLNYFNIVQASSHAINASLPQSVPSLTVTQAYAIDTKIDDGIPNQGRVIANYYVYPSITYASNLPSPSGATCFDTTSNQYSVSQNGGAGVNCFLSIQMQGAAR